MYTWYGNANTAVLFLCKNNLPRTYDKTQVSRVQMHGKMVLVEGQDGMKIKLCTYKVRQIINANGHCKLKNFRCPQVR